MRAPRITAENLTNQVDVVSEEIRLNVLNRPYGGFPWIQLPAILFDSFANAHNGYGDFVDLQAATVADCAEFFETYYTPANAVLTVCGDFDVASATDLIGRHFDDIPYRPAPVRPSFDEPWPTSVREAEHIDQHAPSPALAVGWRLPDPVADLSGYLAFVVLASMLTDGESSRLQSTVVAKAGLATDIWASPGLLGGPLDSRDPDVFVLGAIHPAGRTGRDGDRRGRRADRHAGARTARASRRCSEHSPGSPPRSTGTTTGSPAGPGRWARWNCCTDGPSCSASCPTCCPRSPPTRSRTPPGLSIQALRRPAGRPGILVVRGGVMAPRTAEEIGRTDDRAAAGAADDADHPHPGAVAVPGRAGLRPDGGRGPQTAQPAGRGPAAGAVRRDHPAAQRAGRDARRHHASRDQLARSGAGRRRPGAGRRPPGRLGRPAAADDHRFGAVHRTAGAAGGARRLPDRRRLPAAGRAGRAGAAGRASGHLGHPTVDRRAPVPAAAPVRRAPGGLGHAGRRTRRRCRARPRSAACTPGRWYPAAPPWCWSAT